MAKKPFTMVVTGTSDVNKMMKSYTNRIKDFRPIWDVVNLDIIRIILSHFSNQEGPDGPWKDFAARISGEYQIRKVYRGSGALLTSSSKLLLDTGLLRNSIQVLRSLTKELAVGTNILYGGTHQFGNSSRNIPARPFVWLAPGDEDRIIKTIFNWVDHGGR